MGTLSGAHIECGFVGSAGVGGQIQSLPNPPVWTQTMSTPGTTGSGATDGKGYAPTYDGSNGAPCFAIHCSAQIFVAIGQNPDPVNGSRSLVYPTTSAPWFISCRSGDKLAWIFVP